MDNVALCGFDAWTLRAELLEEGRGCQKAKKNKAESLVLQVSRDLYPFCGGSVCARQRSDPPKT